MEIKFEENAYYRAIQSDPEWESEEKFEKEAKNRLTFAFGRVDFIQFSRNYAIGGWGTRKIVALPMMVWSGVVKTTYHLVLVIFYGIGQGDRKKYAQVYIYCVARDMQEAFGRLVSLFNDQYGLYHIKKSEFQQTAYEFYRENHKDNCIDWDWTSEEVQVQLTKRIIGNECKVFSDEHWRDLSLTSLDSRTVEILFFSSRGISLEEKKRCFGLIPSAEVNAALQQAKLDLNCRVANLFSDEQWRYLSLTSLSFWNIRSLFFPSGEVWDSSNQIAEASLEEKRRRFGLIPSAEVNAALQEEKLSLREGRSFDDLFSDEHWRNLSLSLVGSFDIKRMFSSYLRTDTSLAEKRRRFGLISSEEVNAILLKGVELSADVLSDYQWSCLIPSSLSSKVMSNLFFRYEGYLYPEASLEEKRRRFNLIPCAEVNAALRQDVLKDDPFEDLFSDDQWRRLCLSRLSRETIKAMFFSYRGFLHPTVSLEEKRRRFGLIPSNQVNRALEKSVLEISVITGQLFSDEQKEGLRNANLTEEQKRQLLGQRSRPHFSSFNLVALLETPKAKVCRLLSLKGDASEREIRLAYRKFALKHHPDKVHPGKNESEADFLRRKAALGEQFKAVSPAHKDYEDSLASSA